MLIDFKVFKTVSLQEFASFSIPDWTRRQHKPQRYEIDIEKNAEYQEISCFSLPTPLSIGTSPHNKK